METEDNILVLKFADAGIPEFKEMRGKDWILFGADNEYPDYLTYLYNKSAKHGAIINGKTKYIYGSGLKSDAPTEYVPGKKKPTLRPINNLGETWNDISKKIIKDVEIYGGFRLFVVKDKTGKWSSVNHIEYQKIRTDKKCGFWWKSDWSDRKEVAKHYQEFSEVSTEDICIYSYNEYRPGNGVYPLPEYIACNNYIETDIEISKFHLSAIRNGMMPSKLIQFFNGTPAPEKQKVIEKSWKSKFAGSENAGRFILSFSADKTTPIQVSDLSASELDKQFDILNQTCQQEIFTGHQVVSPMLFGIKTEGQLGGATELKTAYDIFINTYAKPKQEDIELSVNYISGVIGRATDYEFEQLDPIGLQLDSGILVGLLPKRYLYEKLNVPEEYWESDVLPVEQSVGGNDAIRNLSAKQHQQLMRIIRQYGKEQITRDAAAVLLRTGLGLADADIDTILGVQSEFSAQEATEDEIIQMFNECGVHKQDYIVVKQRKVKFETDEDAEADENHYMRQAYKAPRLSDSDQTILKEINKDPTISAETIADLIDSTPEYVESRIGTLTKAGIIEIETKGETTKRTLTKPISDITDLPPVKTAVSIKYSYEGPQDSRNRPFCARLMKLNRMYTRGEIEAISQRLGYSVWDRRGGFWTHKSTGETTPYCRHSWHSVLVVKK